MLPFSPRIIIADGERAAALVNRLPWEGYSSALTRSRTPPTQPEYTPNEQLRPAAGRLRGNQGRTAGDSSLIPRARHIR